MAITDLIPWKRNEANVPIRQEQEEDTLLDLRSQMNRLFDEFFERPFGLSSFTSDRALMRDFTPQLDVSETEDEITVSAELPGMEPEDIHISLDHNALIISGEKHTEKEENNKRFYRLERSSGSFYRSIPLPKEINEDKIDASFKHGVLRVKLSKTQTAQAKKKHIAIKSD